MAYYRCFGSGGGGIDFSKYSLVSYAYRSGTSINISTQVSDLVIISASGSGDTAAKITNVTNLDIVFADEEIYIGYANSTAINVTVNRAYGCTYAVFRT